MTVKLDEIKRVRARLFDKFQLFHERRRGWRRQLRHEMPIELPDDLKKYYADVQNPVLEYDRDSRIKVLMLDSTKIDLTALSEKPQYQRDVEQVRLWSAVSQLKQNEGRWRDQFNAEGQVVDGVAVYRKFWQEPDEYLDSDLPDDIQRAADAASDSMDKREAYFRALPAKQWPFKERGVDVLQCAWDGADLDNPDVFIQEAEVRYYEVAGRKLSGSRKISLSASAKVVVLGPDETVDDGRGTGTQDKLLKYLVYDYRDPETDKRYVCEYVYPSGEFDNGEMVEEYENPLGRCSYFIVPSAEIVRHETDPHYRYRPMMYPLLVVVYTHNFVMTYIAALAQRGVSDQSVYLDPRGVPPETLTALEGMGVRVTGSGQDRFLTFRPPDLGEGEIPVMPGTLQPWPNNLVDALQALLAETKEQIAEFRSSRFLTGNVPDNVVSSTTASTYAASTQAAGLPYGAELVMSDEVQRIDIESEHAAIRFWGSEGEGVDKPYYATAPQEMSFGLSGAQAKPGETARITASLLEERQFLVHVQTSNQTEQEKMLQDQRAYNDYAQRTITQQQLLRRLGHDDPLAQMKDLARDETRALMASNYVPFWNQQLNQLFAVTAGIDPGQLQTPAAGGPPGAGAPPPPASGAAPGPGQQPVRSLVAPPPTSYEGGNSPLGANPTGSGGLG